MKPSTRQRSDQTIQELLNAEIQAEAQLSQMDQNIQALQNKILGKDWWDGNFVIKWSRYLNQQKDHEVNLLPKDRMFSISSVTSKTSAELVKFENYLLDNNPIHAKNQARKYFLDQVRKFHLKIKNDKKLKKQQKKDDIQRPQPQKRRRIKRLNKKLIKTKTVPKISQQIVKNQMP